MKKLKCIMLYTSFVLVGLFVMGIGCWLVIDTWLKYHTIMPITNFLPIGAALMIFYFFFKILRETTIR